MCIYTVFSTKWEAKEQLGASQPIEQCSKPGLFDNFGDDKQYNQ